MSHKRKYTTEEQILKRIDKLYSRAHMLMGKANEKDAEADMQRKCGVLSATEIQSLRDEATLLRKKRFHITNTKLKQLGDALSQLRTPLLPCCNHMDKSITV
jgi:hypothetical protein